MFTGKELKEKRKLLKLSAKKLADILSVKKDNIYKWEKGIRPNNAEDYIKVEKWIHGKLENVPHETNPEDNLINTLSGDDQEKFRTQRDQISYLRACVSVVMNELAAIQSSISGENGAVILKKLYKAAEDMRKLSDG